MAKIFEQIFLDYQKWYQDSYVENQLIGKQCDDREEVEANGWLDPLAQLNPLTTDQIQQIEIKFNKLPHSYQIFLKEIGNGTLLCAREDEPAEVRVLTADDFSKAINLMQKWISLKDKESLLKDKQIDIQKMLPIFADKQWGFLAVIARQTLDDDRIFLLDHAYEAGSPLSKSVSLEKFFKILIEKARRLEALDPFSGLKRSELSLETYE